MMKQTPKTKTIWTPQKGPQVRAWLCPADSILYGGSRGGGKSDCLIGRHLRGAELYQDKWAGLILRRKYKDFGEIRRRWKMLIRDGLPAEIVGGDTQSNTVKFKNGAEVKMTAAGTIDIISDFQGHQYPEISIDEAPNFPFFSKMIDKLRGCNRSPHGVPTSIFCTGNPGGPGHNQVKEFFKLGSEHEAAGLKPNNVMRFEVDLGNDEKATETRIFIQSFLQNNKYLMQDIKYRAALAAIQDPQLRAAWLDGNWDVFLGQAFNFSPERHVIPYQDPPNGSPIYMTFDWGFGKPFTLGWWFVDADGRVIRFNEWYGWNGNPDEGMRIEDSVIAEGIVEREHKWGLTGKVDIRLAGPDCFSKKPDYRGGGQGPSTAEVFANKGVFLSVGDPSRALKIRQFRERLKTMPGERPMLQVMDNCKHFIRTIPAICMDEDHPEDIDTEQEDHIYDEACHIVMARAMALEADQVKKTETDRRIEKLLSGDSDSYESYAVHESEIALRHLQGSDAGFEMDEYADRSW